MPTTAKRTRIALLTAAASTSLTLTATAANAMPVPRPNTTRPAQQDTSVRPQESVPTLTPGGPAKTVTYPPNHQDYTNETTISITAPPRTRIVDVKTHHDQGWWASPSDHSRAIARINYAKWTWNTDKDVVLKADPDAPGGTYSGRFSIDGPSQPLTVHIAHPGRIAATYIDFFGHGLLVIFVEPHSETAASGLKPGDIITAVDGTGIRDKKGLAAALENHYSGDTLPVTVYRAGKSITLHLTLDPVEQSGHKNDTT